MKKFCQRRLNYQLSPNKSFISLQRLPKNISSEYAVSTLIGYIRRTGMEYNVDSDK